MAGAFFIYSSKIFERNKPQIITKNVIYWNLKQPLDILLKDDSGIKFVNATLSDGKNSIVVANKIYANPSPSVHLMIKVPNTSFIYKKEKFKLTVKTVDTSKWNFFSGNSAKKTIEIITDKKRPELYTINSSYGIRKGGSALVVFKASDKNMQELYIKTPFGKKFYPTPFYKKGYYVSLLAWPIKEKKFRADIVAKDKAGNVSRAHVALFIKPMRYRKSTIKLSDNFLNGKVANFIEEVAPKLSKKAPLEQFVYINETVRKKNEALIHKISSKTDESLIKNFHLKPFYPLKNSAAVASFGDYRTYLYKGRKVSNSYHLGIDLASTKMAKIKASNKGEVVFAHFNGIYGNNIIIYHGLGLYSLYGHCSSLLVQQDDMVKRNQTIAKTGKTGMALGDHLHFGILVQGVEVYPKEWMDKHWMKLNIFDVIKDAKKIIDKK
jgi:murein DD-endopeptidase MepM/ murein hydrolase activator NlpD